MRSKVLVIILLMKTTTHVSNSAIEANRHPNWIEPPPQTPIRPCPPDLGGPPWLPLDVETYRVRVIGEDWGEPSIGEVFSFFAPGPGPVKPPADIVTPGETAEWRDFLTALKKKDEESKVEEGSLFPTLLRTLYEMHEIYRQPHSRARFSETYLPPNADDARGNEAEGGSSHVSATRKHNYPRVVQGSKNQGLSDFRDFSSQIEQADTRPRFSSEGAKLSLDEALVLLDGYPRTSSTCTFKEETEDNVYIGIIRFTLLPWPEPDLSSLSLTLCRPE